uniref:Mediator of RNA polymerase II transcription subunit 15 n=1 Tax=Timema bartmani TaxID=61472 RepID=A0A7R9EV60_9NEOP|nr:unnamed protein product [Timema bartmani]
MVQDYSAEENKSEMIEEEINESIEDNAVSLEEYLGFVARLILHVREMNSKKTPGMGGGGQAMQDPINALQTLARQGTGNNQIMGLGPSPGPGMGPQNTQSATNLLQTLNQRPNQTLNNLQNLQGKMPDLVMQGGPQMPGQIGNQMPGQLGHMGQMVQQRKGNEGMMMAGQNTGFPGPRSVPPGQFFRQSPSPSAPSPVGLGSAPTSNQMTASSPALVPSPNPQHAPMSVSQRSVGMAPSPSSSLNTPGPAVPTPSPCNMQEDQAYRDKVRQLSKYIEPLRRMIARMGNDEYAGLEVTCQTEYADLEVTCQTEYADLEATCRTVCWSVGCLFRQSAGLEVICSDSTGLQVVCQTELAGLELTCQTKYAGLEATCWTVCWSVAYLLDKVCWSGGCLFRHHWFADRLLVWRLSLRQCVGLEVISQTKHTVLKVIGQTEHTDLKVMGQTKHAGLEGYLSQTAHWSGDYQSDRTRWSGGYWSSERTGTELTYVEKLSKMKKLLEILSNPNKRMPLETLLKCEVVLEKLDLKRGESSVAPQPQLAGLKEAHIFTPLLEAVASTLQSPVANHTLQRTLGPCLEALFGPELKLVSLDPVHQPGSRSVQLLCWLDDKHLPCVPPISVSVPEDYPRSPPSCHMASHEYGSTQFLSAVQTALMARVRKLPCRFSVSQLLDTWEMSVRQASAPAHMPLSAATVLMGL